MAEPSTPAHSPAARWADASLAALVVAFAFLAASFPARNSDLWQHLAVGRLVAHGDYTFGVDPFAYTTQGIYWANHAWLFDLTIYGVYSTWGGAVLVVLKAITVASMAGLMLRVAWLDGPFWVSGFCVLLAVLAMSPRLLLQPACLSLLLLAACLALLGMGGRALYALPAVIVLWVNVDGWFLLGPMLVALFGLGQLLTPATPDHWRLPLWLLPTCLIACLISPHHVRGLTLPMELSPGVWRSELRHDARFAALFASPWSIAPLGPAGDISLSAWAYFVLLTLGLLSFVVNRAALRSWRLPVWLGFALLGAWQVRLVPFFAVVGGPIAAQNLGARGGRWTLAGFERVGLLTIGFVLLALTWPGWLQGIHRRDRPLAWEVRVDPSLHQVAETLADWRQDGPLPEAVRTFALHPDVAHYCAWFCPGEKCFLDGRLPLFLNVIDDYLSVCFALNPAERDGASRTGPQTDWQRTLRDHNVSCLVLYDPDLRRMAPGLRQVTQSAERWELLRVDGQAVVVGWKGMPGHPWSPRRFFDAERLAFVVDPDATVEAPARLNNPLPWWQSYLVRQDQSTGVADRAAVLLRMFHDGARQQTTLKETPLLAQQAAGLIGVPASVKGMPGAIAVVTRWPLEGIGFPNAGNQSPALPLLAIRDARRAVAANPSDASAWLVLAQAYLALGRTTTEANPTAALPPLTQVRHVQTVTALLQAVTLKPDLAAAHEALAQLYAEQQFTDLALRHRVLQLRLLRRAGPQANEDKAAYYDRVQRLQEAVEKIERTVQDNENRFVIGSDYLAANPLGRARLALRLGLAGKAVDEVLLRSHADLYGVEGLRLLLELLLLTGRAQEARDLLDRGELRRNPDGLGFYDLAGGRGWSYRFPAYDWFDLCQTAAVGNYDSASRALERMRVRMKQQGEQIGSLLSGAVAWRVASEVGLSTDLAALCLRGQARAERNLVVGLLLQCQFLRVVRADLHVLDGMLLLERGWPGQAGAQFNRSLALYREAADTAPALAGQPLAISYLERLANRK